MRCQCSKKPEKKRGKCGTCSAIRPGPDVGSPNKYPCADKLNANTVDRLIWVVNNDNSDWTNHTAGGQGAWLKSLAVKKAIVVPLVPTNVPEYLNNKSCNPVKGGGNAGFPGKVASDFCKTFKGGPGECEIYMGVSMNIKGPKPNPKGLSRDGALSNKTSIQHLVGLFRACMLNGNGAPGTFWNETESGPLPNVTGIICVEGSPSDCFPDAEHPISRYADANLSVGSLKSNAGSYITNPMEQAGITGSPAAFTIGGGEFYNPFNAQSPSKGCPRTKDPVCLCPKPEKDLPISQQACCQGNNGSGNYGPTANSYGDAMAVQANYIASTSMPQGYPNAPGATGFAGYAGATCTARGKDLKDIMSAYFGSLEEARLPRDDKNDTQCNFGIWG